LIELLIVVAIIAILALIAVPNFLEAQTRAKVSRAMNDLRTLSVGIAAYQVDNTAWPINVQYETATLRQIVDAHGWPWEYGQWYILTTPIAYLTSIPHDTFRREFNEQWNIWQDFYRCWNLGDANRPASAWGGVSTQNLARNGVCVLTASVGPDCVEDVSDGTAGTGLPGQTGIVFYDPTNGTVSWGDIYRGVPGDFDLFHKAL
jgi:type II secretory pathway pseudopilin PulG